jgi:hypothetical protein
MAAIKKTTVKPSTKLVKKTLTKKPLAAKTNTEKIARSNSLGATLAKISVTKKTTLRKKPVNTHRKISRIKKVDTVSLPNNMSLRAVDKSYAFKSAFDEFFRYPMYRIAYVSGLCFLLVGSFFAVNHLVPSNVSHLMVGLLNESNLIATTSNATLNTDTSIRTNLGKVPDPTFKFISKIPDQINDDFRVNFIVSDAEMVSTRLSRIGYQDFSKLETTKLTGNKYRVNISAANLSNSIYNLKVYVTPSNGNNSTIFESTEFRVVNDSDVTINDASKTSISNTTDEPINPVAIEENIGQIIPTTTDTLLVDGKEDSTISTKKIITESTIEVQSNPINEPIVDSLDILSEKRATPFALLVPSDLVLSGVKTIKVSAPKNYPWIELYARPISSLDTLFVARSVKRSGEWYFVIDSTNIPNGKYEFTAKTKFNDLNIKTRPILVLVANNVESYLKETILPDVSDDTEMKEVSVRELPPRLEEQNFVRTVILEDDVKRETENLLVKNEADINTLFKHYATAQQSGDEMLIRTAKEALQEKRKALVTETLYDERLRDISDNIDEELTLRIVNLEEKVNTFEKIRREKSLGKTAIDSDRDGISDFDEIHLYDTNPEAIDTDNDGITDGIEIMRGYNPNDAASESVVEFESPRETVGLLRDDVLKVEEVLPVIQVSDTEEPSIVKAEIKGKGLPNSFVTLYIYSTPTVVTIKTNADGEFVYTFDKELEDGQHDIYIAMTDNAGEIIAQSSPFSFFKQAQAFTVVNGADSELVTSDNVVESVKSSYNTVVGMGILAFGLILLMLGMTLRPKNDDLDDGSDNGSNSKKVRFTIDGNNRNESS